MLILVIYYMICLKFPSLHLGPMIYKLYKRTADVLQFGRENMKFDIRLLW